MDKNTKIGVAGAGIEGMAMAKYLLSHGFKNITVFDEREEGEVMPDGLKIIRDTKAFDLITDIDVVFRSPGVHPNKLNRVKNAGVKISGMTQYFLENCPCRVIGVTGTKGKGTTSTLIYEILKGAGHDVYLGGNIGEPPLNFLDDVGAKSVVVLELSSFQLQDITRSPEMAVVLMTTSEHLDYHADREDYWRAKLPILKFQTENDFCVLNKDYEYFREFYKCGKGEKLAVSRKESVEKGAFVLNEGFYYLDEKSDRNEPEFICNAQEAGLIGRHNRENILAAICVCKKLGVPVAVIAGVIKAFTGLEHRLEFVREKDGIRFYNDSFSTTPETSVAGVYAFNDPVLLIAGGSEKNSDFREWAEELQKCEKLKNVFLMGVTADRMEKELNAVLERENVPFPVTVYRCANLEEAVKMAFERAVSGDNIVMSPGAASFDMFNNYKYRGVAFREIVKTL